MCLSKQKGVKQVNQKKNKGATEKTTWKQIQHKQSGTNQAAKTFTCAQSFGMKIEYNYTFATNQAHVYASFGGAGIQACALLLLRSSTNAICDCKSRHYVNTNHSVSSNRLLQTILQTSVMWWYWIRLQKSKLSKTISLRLFKTHNISVSADKARKN